MQTGSQTTNALLALQRIEKSFFGVRVLKDVNLSLETGRIVGVVGENGAGKSTLMNILGGNLRADAGEMLLNGALYEPKHPTDATRAGIAFVHQELNLFPNLSIAENLFLTSFPRSFVSFIARRKLRERAEELLHDVGLDLAPDTMVERLPAGERQLVEIAKALSLSPKLIIFDEPTTSLSARETEHLFALVDRLRARGVAMIYISHILGDVLRLCDDIVVLRDGEVVGSGPRADFTNERMISLMVGRSLNQLYPKRAAADRGSVTRSTVVSPDALRLPEPRSEHCPLLELCRVTQPHIVRDISFALHRGEVLGISGLMGAGRSELARIIFGLDPYSTGEIWLNGQLLSRSGPRERIQRGVAFLTEDRRHEGLCLEASIADNMALVALRRHASTPLKLLNTTTWRDAVHSLRDAVQLSPTARATQPVKTLSGGNQQKVVLGKWLMAEPKLFILDEPARGIDVGARLEIYQLIHRLADGGAGLLVISSEIEELIGICDRILVMSQGEIRDELRAGEFDRERILRSALLARELPASA